MVLSLCIPYYNVVLAVFYCFSVKKGLLTKNFGVLLGSYVLFSYFCKRIANQRPIRKDSFIYRVFDLYYDGFKNMKLGRTLWAIILIKLFIIFAVLKVFFFPNFLKEHANGDEAGYVATQILNQ